VPDSEEEKERALLIGLTNPNRIDGTLREGVREKKRRKQKSLFNHSLFLPRMEKGGGGLESSAAITARKEKKKRKNEDSFIKSIISLRYLAGEKRLVISHKRGRRTVVNLAIISTYRRIGAITMSRGRRGGLRLVFFTWGEDGSVIGEDVLLFLFLPEGSARTCTEEKKEKEEKLGLPLRTNTTPKKRRSKGESKTALSRRRSGRAVVGREGGNRSRSASCGKKENMSDVPFFLI